MAFDSFKGLKFTAITASALTKKKEPYRKIPSVLREGRKSRKNKGFFDYKNFRKQYFYFLLMLHLTL